MYTVNEIGPAIVLIDNAIDDPKAVIDMAFAKAGDSEVSNAKIYNSYGESHYQKNIRDTKTIDISPSYNNDIFWWSLAQKIWSHVDSYGKQYRARFSNMEPPQFLWYKKNEGFYNAHSDSDGSIFREISAVLYLNDVEDGGETYFENFDLSIKPKAGSLAIFPSSYAYIHGANVPVSNDKFVVVTWFTA